MFFTVDSILILLLSRWPLTRNRTKSFHSRCNELHHLCICQRKELSQSTCPALVHQISPLWPVQGKWVCRAHKAAMVTASFTEILTPNSEPAVPAAGSTSGQAAGGGVARKHDAVLWSLLFPFNLPAAVRIGEDGSNHFSSDWLSSHLWTVQPRVPPIDHFSFSSGKLSLSAKGL